MRGRFFVPGVLCLAWLCGGARALAAPDAAPAARQSDGATADTDATAQARAHYRLGASAYRAGRYREAIEAFAKADALIPSAALSFNIARAHEKLGDPTNAVIWYRDYLQRAGYASDRKRIEAHVAALEQTPSANVQQRLSVSSFPEGAALRLDGQPAGSTPWSGPLSPGAHRLDLRLPGYADVSQSVWVKPDAPMDVRIALSRAAPVMTTTPPIAGREPRELTGPSSARAVPSRAPEEPRGNAVRTWGYVAAGVGGAALGGGVVFELLRRGSESDARNDPRQVSFAEKYDTMERQAAAARILFVSGAVLLATGGVLIVAGSRSAESKPGVSAACLPGGCSATFRGRF